MFLAHYVLTPSVFSAALVESTIFCMHGGLSPDLLNPRDLNKVERPLDIPNKGVLCDLLWSDPDPVGRLQNNNQSELVI